MTRVYKLFRGWLPAVAVVLLGLGAARGASVPAGFTETVIPGPFAGLWGKPVGTTFDGAGRQLVWERLGRIWIKGPTETNFSLLLSIEEEQGTEGLLAFAIDPAFQANGYIYLLYVVDRHHLLYFGTGSYNSSSNLYNEATIARLTRYTCVASNDFKSVDPTSRLILIGDAKTNGFPVCFSTHTVGSLVFGQDGTLLASCGDTASFSAADIGGALGGSYAPQALADGIIQPKENVGSYRAQLVDCLNGKVIRVDPATGDGLPSNPYYDPARPRAAKSRVWALGFRNPFRMTIRPNSGSHNPADGNPGALYVGDVMFDTREALKVVTGPGQNFGWPLYEGLELTPPYSGGGTFNVDVNNLDATNAQCGGYFSFRQLLKQETTNVANYPPFNNPCNASVKIPTNIPQFLHHRSALDWDHFSVTTRTPTFDAAGNATIANVGAVGSPVAGVQFQGNCSIGGAWYDGTGFPAAYQNKYYHGDWGQGVIKMMTFDASNRPTTVSNFASNVASIVNLVQHPFDGSLYYVIYDGDTGTVRKLAYTGNRTPVAVATADQYYGPGPLTVQFNGAGSSDPDGHALAYSWNFGDGTALSTLASPAHVFTAPGSTRTNYQVTLTVTDTGGLPASTTLNIALNDTPPNVTITSPTNGGFYSPGSNTFFNLTATVNDAESSDSQLTYLWQSVLHHNDHNHVEATSTNHVSSTSLEPVGCDGANIYYYRIILTVTDPRGLATTREVQLFPNCGTTDTPPTITDISNQSLTIGQATAPIPFIIGDAQVAAANLQLSAGSSNPTLVPTNNIVLGGFGASRTVTVTPAAGLNGTSTITVNVNDGPNNTADTFLLTVGGSNTPPTISSIANQTVGEGTPATAVCTVADANTPLANLSLSASSSNPTLVPANNFTFGGSGSNRTVTAIPAAGQTGTTTIAVTVSDGSLSASNSYTLTVTNLPAGTRSSTNAAAIAILDASAGSPYPSVINIGGLGGAVTNVTVTLRSLSHQWGRDIDALLVGPGGQTVMFMSDAGTTPTATNANFTFSDSAAGFLPATGSLVGGTYKPTDYTNLNLVADAMPAPAPGGPYATNLSVFNGQIANGPWSLYVMDDGPGDTGSIAGGWSLTITTSGSTNANTAPVLSAISNQVTVVNTATAALPFTIGDAETAASNLVLSVFTSNASLVPTNKIVLGGSGTNRTVTVTPSSNQLGSVTISLNVSDGALVASNSFVLTVNPAVLTVTENSASRGYGLANPVLSGLVSGLQAGDNITASFSSLATTNSPVGVYAIAFSLSDPGNKLGNYSIVTNNGTLTVTNAILMVSAVSTNKVYGTNFAFGGTEFAIASGTLFNGNTLTNVTLASAGATNTAPAGSYAITATNALGAGLTNYSIGYSNGTLVVMPAPLVAKADNKSRAYGQQNPVFTISYTGFVNGDGTNVLDVLPIAGTTATNTTAPGDYVIAISGGADDNYSVSRVAGTLTITAPGPVTITTVEIVGGVNVRLAGTGDANVSYKVQASANLVDWTEIGTAAADDSGAFEFVDGSATAYDARYYRISTP